MTLSTSDLASRVSETAAVIRASIPEIPTIAVVLGSGLGALVEGLADRVALPYTVLPHYPVPGVAGHAGNVVAGKFDGAPVLMLQGRIHYYEGHELDLVTFPIRVLQGLGIRTLILTAATGGIRVDLRPGNLICLSDHLNMIGINPLRGAHDPRLGARFPDMSEVYSARLRTLAKEEAKRLGINLGSGVYACMPGPSYETPAEIKMLRTLGADVVGMSTVPEAIVARHAGMEVLGLALVTNPAAGVTNAPVSHDEVLEAGRKATPLLGRLIRRLAIRLAEQPPSPPLSPTT